MDESWKELTVTTGRQPLGMNTLPGAISSTTTLRARKSRWGSHPMARTGFLDHALTFSVRSTHSSMNSLALPPRAKPGLIRSLPMLVLALIAYNLALTMGHDFRLPPSQPLWQATLISGAAWSAGWNEVMIVGGLALLFIEILKSTRTTQSSTLEHLLSMLVFIIFIVEFLVVAGAGTNVFFLLGLMSLIDVMGGYAISIAVARKDLNIT